MNTLITCVMMCYDSTQGNIRVTPHIRGVLEYFYSTTIGIITT